MATQPSGPEAGGGVAGSNKGAVAGDLNDPAVSTDDQVLIGALALPGDIGAIPRHKPGGRQLTVDGARELTERIKFDAQTLWMQLLRAFEGNAHGALGYDSWHAYCRAELQIEAAQSYRLLSAAKVAGFLHSPMGEWNQAPITERVARELKPLLSDPEKLREVYAEAAEISRDADGAPKPPTAAAVREIVQKRLAPRASEAAPAAAIEKPRPSIGINAAVSALRRAIDRDRESAPMALAALREVASRGLYGPKTENPVEAFRGLVEIVATLLRGVP